MAEHRRIVLNGAVTPVLVAGDELVAGDGRHIATADAVNLPPCEPSKILCVHLNHISRVREFQANPAGQLLKAQLYNVAPMSPLVLAGVTMLLAVVAILATMIPAWRASKINPIIVLGK